MGPLLPGSGSTGRWWLSSGSLNSRQGSASLYQSVWILRGKAGIQNTPPCPPLSAPSQGLSESLSHAECKTSKRLPCSSVKACGRTRGRELR